MTKIHNIAKNTSYLTLALIVQKVISFAYFVLLARFLGPADMGKYYLAISLTTIFSVFIDFGLTNVLTRETAKQPEAASRWLGNILTLKLPLSLLSVLGILALVAVSGYDETTRLLVYISCASMVLDSFTGTVFGAVRGFHNLKYESFASVLFQLIVLVFGYGALRLGGGLAWAMAALALASLANLAYGLFVARRRIGLKLVLLAEKPFMRELLGISWPFALYGIFQRLYTYLDTVLLSFLAGAHAVGLYQVAFKIIFALQFLPLAFTASLYPALSSYWQNNRQQLAVSFERSINYLTIISLPIIVGTVALAGKISLLLKSGFEDSVLPLQISIISLFFIFINFPIGSLLNACDRQGKNTLNMGIVAALSLALNFLLIPRWQAVGASLTVLITNIVMTGLGLFWAKRIISYRSRNNFKVGLKSLLASLLMGALILAGREYLNIFVLVALGAAIYFLILFWLGGFRRADIASVLASFKLR